MSAVALSPAALAAHGGVSPARRVRMGIFCAALGVLMAWKSLALIAAWLPQGSFPAESVIKMNLPVLVFSVALAVVTAVVFGLSPALQLSRPNIASLMQSSMRRIVGAIHGGRTHNILVASQVALTVLLLASAGAVCSGK